MRWPRPELARRIAEAFAQERPVGLMFHHAVTDADERLAVGDLLALVVAHPSACPLSIAELANR